MKTVHISKFGSIDDLAIRQIPAPASPVDSHVLVRVHAAGLNRADLLQVRGSYPPPKGYSPNIPGLEFAGEVVAIGNGVNTWSAGERVFGITAGEAQAEFLLSDASLLARIPDNLSFTEAAAVPEAFITAHDAIFTLGGLKKNEALLIHAVGSGVGLAALQIAKAKGAFVIGTSRTDEKLERCNEFGLDAAIVTGDAVDFASAVKEATNGNGADVILDLVGAAYFQQNLASSAMKGRLILVGLPSGAKAEFNLGIALQKRLRITGTMLRGRSIEEKADAVKRFSDEVVPLFESGKVRPNLDRAFDIENVVDAYKYLESNKSFGKIVLEF